MLLIVGTLRLPAGKVDAARPAMERVIAATRAEEGCLEYCYAEDMSDPGLIHITERWTDRPALDRHFAAPHLAEWRAAWPDLGVGDRDLNLYEVAEPVRI